MTTYDNKSSIVKKRAFRLLIAYLFCLSTLLLRGQQQQNQPLEIINKCHTEMQSLTSYVRTSANETTLGAIKLSTSQKIFFKRNPDGTIWQRTESVTSPNVVKYPSVNVIQINNDEGTWQLYPDRKLAVKCNFIAEGQKSITQAAASTLAASNQEKDDSTYAIVEKSQDGIPIFAITKTLSDQKYNETLNATKQIFAAADPTSKADVTPMTPYIVEEDIRQTDFVLVGEVTYNKNGDLISSATYTDIELNIPLADDLFSIPNEYRSTIADSPQDLAKLTFK